MPNALIIAVCLLLAACGGGAARSTTADPAAAPTVDGAVAQRYRYEQAYHNFRTLIRPVALEGDRESLARMAKDFAAQNPEPVAWIGILRRRPDGSWQPLLQEVYRMVELGALKPEAAAGSLVAYAIDRRAAVCETAPAADGSLPDGLHLRLVFARDAR